MKFRYRLMVAFLIVLFLPILLITLVGVLFFGSQRDRFEAAYNNGLGREKGDMSAATVSGMCETAAIRVLQEIDNDPTRFTEPAKLVKYNLDLVKEMNCFLIRYEGSNWKYSGDIRVSDAFLEQIGKNAQTERVLYYADDNLFYKVVNLDINSQKEIGKILVATFGNHNYPEFQSIVTLFVLCSVLVLVLTSTLITVNISRSIIRPIREVQAASRRVRDGDLDHELVIKDKEFQALCDDFNQMRMRLKESERIKAQADEENHELISNISHDLKTPLTAIKGYVEGLMDNIADTPERRERYLATIYNKTNDMQRLIDELTFYSRIDSNRVPYNFVPIRIVDFFRDCAEETELDLTSRGMKLEFSCEVEEEIQVKADPEQLRRVVSNIIGNSVKYMDKPDGAVGIHLSRDEKKVYAELMDNGPGISEEALPYIFDRFYRADEARNQNQAGSGIGLSIVQKVIEDHGGSVYATSKLGEGTKITIELAIYQEDEVREDEKNLDR